MAAWRLTALGVLGLAVSLLLGRFATLPPPVYFLHDQRHYLAMAAPTSPPSEAQRTAPFAWRVLPPALVRASGLPGETGFHALTLLALTLIPPAIAVMLAGAGVSSSTALAMGAVAALAPAVAGYLSWDYIRPDAPALLLIVLAAWSAIGARPMLFLVALAALSLTKETWLVSAAFALIWTRAYQPAFLKWAVAGSVMALFMAVGVRLAIPSMTPYSPLSIVRELYWPLDITTVARRLLFATATTWNVLVPLLAVALAQRIREPRAWAVAAAVLVAGGQILVALDTQRIVAAAYPFVLLGVAWEIDRLTPRRRAVAGLLVALAQIPWLLTFGRVWPLPLRGVEVAIVGISIVAVVYCLVRPRALPAGAL